MKPVDQEGSSDCLRACIASIFELKLVDVPLFGSSYLDTKEAAADKIADPKKWSSKAAMAQDVELRKWLADRGLSHRDITEPNAALAAGAKSAQLPWGFCVAGGKSPRGEFDHAIVYDCRGDEPVMAHDPHPDRTGFDGEPKHFTCFLVEDPTLSAKKEEISELKKAKGYTRSAMRWWILAIIFAVVNLAHSVWNLFLK